VNYAYLETPIGTLLIAGDESALRRIAFPQRGNAVRPEPDWRASTRGPVGEARRQLREYFAGRRSDFDVPLAPEGTAFQRAVWQRLREIPYAATISYGELARRVGNPKASRAVGSANGANPLPIVIPCHRVIAGDGTLGGFGGGLPTKQVLLDLEQRGPAVKPAAGLWFGVARSQLQNRSRGL
jgi:methylated-DNA-[protein]-cysteine S-methyltransferase